VTTLNDMINEVHLNLLGFVLDQEQLTGLTVECDPTDPSF
jgi:hypothetical protein